MYSADKLPLVQKAFTMLTENLDERDRVSIVTYAGYESVVLDGVFRYAEGKRLPRRLMIWKPEVLPQGQPVLSGPMSLRRRILSRAGIIG